MWRVDVNGTGAGEGMIVKKGRKVGRQEIYVCTLAGPIVHYFCRFIHCKHRAGDTARIPCTTILSRDSITIRENLTGSGPGLPGLSELPAARIFVYVYVEYRLCRYRYIHCIAQHILDSPTLCFLALSLYCFCLAPAFQPSGNTKFTPFSSVVDI